MANLGAPWFDQLDVPAPVTGVDTHAEFDHRDERTDEEAAPGLIAAPRLRDHVMGATPR